MSEDGDMWHAVPAVVTSLWRPPPPPVRDEDGQFSDAGDSDEESEPVWGAPSSLQTVVNAPVVSASAAATSSLQASVVNATAVTAPTAAAATAVPRLTFNDMVATPQPLPDSEDAWEVPTLPGRLSGLSLDDGTTSRHAGAVSTDVSPRSVAGTASVSLRSYLDPAAVSADLTADMTDCETLDQLAELADSSRTVRQAPSSSPPVGDTASVTSAENYMTSVKGAVTPEESAITSERPDLSVTSEKGVVMSEESEMTSERPSARSLEEGEVRTEMVTAGALTMLKETCRGGTVTSFVMSAAQAVASTARGVNRGGAVVRSRSAERSLTTGGGGVSRQTVAARMGMAYDRSYQMGLNDDNRGICNGLLPSVESSRSEPVAQPVTQPHHSLSTNATSTRPALPSIAVSQAPVSASPPDTVLAPPSASVDSGRGDSTDALTSARTDAAPSSRTTGDAPHADLAGGEPSSETPASPGRRRAFKRSPARRLSFTLESPSPLLVEYYLKHPEERLQVLENAAAMDPDASLLSAPDHEPAPALDLSLPACSTTRDALHAAETSHAAKTGSERPRRRWTDEATSAAELRAALAERRASVDTVLSSPRQSEEPSTVPGNVAAHATSVHDAAHAPYKVHAAEAAHDTAAGVRLPDVPLGWGSVLHSLSAAEESRQPPAHHHHHQQTTAAGVPGVGVARTGRWRVSAPPPPPSATLDLSPRPAATGSPSGRRRRVRSSPRPRRTPPALSPLTLPRRPTPNFDSHAIQEIVQGRSPTGAGVGWGTPSPPAPRAPLTRRSPVPAAAPAPTRDRTAEASSDLATAAADLQDIFSLPALDELRQLLALHERQAAALVEQHRRERRALEAACRRREEAVLQRLRRQLAAAELLAAPPPDSRPSSPSAAGAGAGGRAERRSEGSDAVAGGGGGAGDGVKDAEGFRSRGSGAEYRDPPLTYRCSPRTTPEPREYLSDPSAYERYESQLGTPPARGRPPRPPTTDPVPTPVARRLGSPVGTSDHPVHVPAEALAPGMEVRYAKVTAAARGYLTRRLMRTEKVQSLISAAKESMMCALRLQREVDLTKQITKQDVELHERLVNQVRGACYSLHQLFIASTTRQRLAVIAADRAARAHAAERRRDASSDPPGRLSHATLLAIQRKRHRDSAPGGRPATTSPRARPRQTTGGSPRARTASAAVSASPKSRSSPAGRPRRVVAHSPRAGSRSSLLSERTGGGGSGRTSRAARSLIQLANIYAPNPARRVKSGQSQLTTSGYGAPQAGEPKRRQRSGRVWR